MSSSESTPSLKYHHGYGNEIESESYPGALPKHRNNPRYHPLGLYTEQLSGTAFTAPRHDNKRTWLYRIRPSVSGSSSLFHPCGSSSNGGGGVVDQDVSSMAQRLPKTFGHADWSTDMKLDPNPMRWGAMQLSSSSNASNNINFIQGMQTLAGSGDPTCKSGIGIYVYAFNSNMYNENMSMYNSDGDLLIVPQQLTLDVQTELGLMTISPGEICVIPRGVVFTVNILGKKSSGANEKDDEKKEKESFARGYMLEIFRGHFTLPELGPIGSNGLANARDFLHPSAYYDDESNISQQHTIINKFGQELFLRSNAHSPYNVVAWHGNYLPFKYDLRNFCAMNSVTYDHPDPSIYTVLTARGGDEEGTALADFVIFPPRIMATGELFIFIMSLSLVCLCIIVCHHFHFQYIENIYATRIPLMTFLSLHCIIYIIR